MGKQCRKTKGLHPASARDTERKKSPPKTNPQPSPTINSLLCYQQHYRTVSEEPSLPLLRNTSLRQESKRSLRLSRMQCSFSWLIKEACMEERCRVLHYLFCEGLLNRSWSPPSVAERGWVGSQATRFQVPLLHIRVPRLLLP